MLHLNLFTTVFYCRYFVQQMQKEITKVPHVIYYMTHHCASKTLDVKLSPNFTLKNMAIRRLQSFICCLTLHGSKSIFLRCGSEQHIVYAEVNGICVHSNRVVVINVFNW